MDITNPAPGITRAGASYYLGHGLQDRMKAS
jgi:hypothetical protein